MLTCWSSLSKLVGVFDPPHCVDQPFDFFEGVLEVRVPEHGPLNDGNNNRYDNPKGVKHLSSLCMPYPHITDANGECATKSGGMRCMNGVY
jgi:hypothetical protein